MKKSKITFTRYDAEELLSALNNGEELFDTWTIKVGKKEVLLEIRIEE